MTTSSPTLPKNLLKPDDVRLRLTITDADDDPNSVEVIPTTWGEFRRDNEDCPDVVIEAWDVVRRLKPRAVFGGGAAPIFVVERIDDEAAEAKVVIVDAKGDPR